MRYFEFRVKSCERVRKEARSLSPCFKSNAERIPVEGKTARDKNVTVFGCNITFEGHQSLDIILVGEFEPRLHAEDDNF